MNNMQILQLALVFAASAIAFILWNEDALTWMVKILLVRRDVMIASRKAAIHERIRSNQQWSAEFGLHSKPLLLAINEQDKSASKRITERGSRMDAPSGAMKEGA